MSPEAASPRSISCSSASGTEAAEVFRDRLHDSVPDEFSVGERRFKTTGVVRGIGLIVVIHTVENEGQDDELIRIISARRTERHERKAYEDG